MSNRSDIARGAKTRLSGAILTDLKHRLAEIYDLNAASSVLAWDEAIYAQQRAVGKLQSCDALRTSASPTRRWDDCWIVWSSPPTISLLRMAI